MVAELLARNLDRVERVLVEVGLDAAVDGHGGVGLVGGRVQQQGHMLGHGCLRDAGARALKSFKSLLRVA